MNSLPLTQALFQQLPPYQNSKGKIIKSARSCPACHSGKLNFSGDSYFFKVCGCSYADIYKAGRKFLGGDFDTSEYKEKQEQKRQEREQVQREKLQGRLTADQLDKSIRALAGSYGLRKKHQDKLIERGFSLDQIKEKLFFSISKGENDLPPGIPGNFPGVNRKGKLYSNYSGIACVFIDVNGKALSWQVRDDDPASENKYTWLFDSKVKVNESSEELPLNVFLPPIPADTEIKNNTAILTEGGPIKGVIPGYSFNIPVISAAGGYFSASPNQIRQAIEQLGISNIILAIDGGDICNDQRRVHWQKEVSFLVEKLGVTVSILWYQQWEKSGLDLDEIAPDQLFPKIELLTLKEWLGLDYIHWKLGEIRKGYRHLTGAKIINPDQKYLDLTGEYDAIKSARLINIKAPFGSGKTKQQLELAIKKLDKDKLPLLINLTYLNSLSRGLQGRSGNLFKHLQDHDGIPGNSNLSFCHQSLFKFKNDREELRGRRVFIDEVVSMIENMLTGSNVSDRFLIFELFRELLVNSEKVFISDANLSDTEIDFIKTLMGIDDSQVLTLEKLPYDGSQFKIIIRDTWYQCKEDQGKEESRGKDSEGVLSREILSFLGIGKKIVVTSESQKDLEVLHNQALRQFPNLKIVRTDSRTVRNADKKIEQLTENFLKYPDKTITEEKPDLLLISPLCNSGTDISIENYFFRQYHLSRGILNVNGTAQLLGRVRDTEVEKHIFFLKSDIDTYFPSIGDIFHNDARLEVARSQDIRERVASALTAFSDSEADLVNHERFVNNQAEALIGKYFQEFSLARKLDTLTQYERNNIKELLPDYLRDKRHNLIEIKNTASDQLDQSSKQEKKQIKEKEAKAIFEADYIPLDTPADQLPNTDQVEFINLEGRTVQKPDSVGLLNYSYRQRLPGIEKTESWNPDLIYTLHFSDKKLIERLSLYHLLQNPDRASNLKVSRTKNYLNNSPDFIENYDRLTPVVDCLRYLGIDKLLERITPYTGNDDQIKQIASKYKNKKNRLSQKSRELLGIDPDKIGNCQLVAMILGKIEVSTRGEKKEKEVNGTRKTWTEYSVKLPGLPRYKKLTKKQEKEGLAPELIPSPIPDLLGAIVTKYDRYSADKFNIDTEVNQVQQEQTADPVMPADIAPAPIPAIPAPADIAPSPVDSINTFNPAPAPIPAGKIADQQKILKPGDFVRFADGWDDIKYQILAISSKGVAKVRGLYGQIVHPTIDVLIPA